MFKYFCIAVILQITWSLTPSASNIVIQYIPVELYIALRWSISGLIFLFITIFKYKRIQSSPKIIFQASILGILGFGIASLGTLYGLKVGGVINFALMGSISPIITAIVSIVVLKERFNNYYLLAASICVMGLLLLMLGKYQISSISVAASATVLIFGAYFFEALPFTFSKRLTKDIPLIEYMGISQIAAATFMWIMQILLFHQIEEAFNAPTQAWAALLFVSIVACTICYFVLYWLLNFISGHKLALFDGLHTVFAALFGYAFFKEYFNSTMVTGGVLLLIGLYMANSKRAMVENIDLKG